MAETVRELIARLSAEIERDDGWMEIDLVDDGPCLVGGSIVCGAEIVEFDDDSGFRAAVPYDLVCAVRTGRQGFHENGLRRFTIEREPQEYRRAG